MIKFLRRIFGIKTRRYFIVYYTAYTKTGEVRGNCIFPIYGINPFLNYMQIYERSKVKTESISQFIITGYNEMTKQEYKRLIGED